MKIAVDAMGGDSGLRITIPGAVQAARESEVDVIFVGEAREIQAEMTRLSLSVAASGAIVSADFRTLLIMAGMSPS